MAAGRYLPHVLVALSAGCPPGRSGEPTVHVPPICVTKVERVEVRGLSLVGWASPGEELTLWVGYYACRPAQRGELAAFRHPGFAAPLLKRIVAVPDDRFSVTTREAGCTRLRVNDRVVLSGEGQPACLDETGRRLLDLYARDNAGTVPPNAVMLLGSGETASLDSGRFGLVDQRELVGRAVRGADAVTTPQRCQPSRN